MRRRDRSPVSLTGLFTGQVWQANHLAPAGLETRAGKWLYRCIRPLDQLSDQVLGISLETLLLQRHLLLDQQVREAIDAGYTQIVELASGLSARAGRMLERYPHAHLRWVEADLPDMVRWKLQGQTKAPLFDTRWRIEEVNILREQGDMSVDQLLASLDPHRKTLVITEGLVNYFPLPVISAFWQRLHRQLSQFPQARYLFEIWPALPSHPDYWLTQLSGQAIGLLTGQRIPFHYGDDESIRLGVQRAGFAKTQVINPDHKTTHCGLPSMRKPSLFRVVQAEARAEEAPPS